jgi:hypothetical protein
MSNASTCFSKSACAAILALAAAALCGAQTLPCGRGKPRMGETGIEIRFFPSPAEHVHASVLRALPAMAAHVTKDQNGVIEAKFGMSFSENASTIDTLTSGTFRVGVKPATYGGIAGSLLSVDTNSTGNYATPLADEVACLVGLLSPADPASNPRGQTSVSPAASTREVPVPAKKGLTVVLRNYIYSKEISNGAVSGTVSSAPPVFEVLEDVTVDGATVFRKGALAKGKLTQFTAAKSAQRGASIQLSVESATAADGQEIALEGGSVKEQGQVARRVVQQHIATGAAVGGLAGALIAAAATKGQEALIPAGTTFEVQVVRPVTVKAEPAPAIPPATPTAAAKSGSAPVLNVDGNWYWSRWGEIGLFQAAGEREVVGRGAGYDIDGVAGETGVVLRFNDGGTVEYTAQLSPKGDGNILFGQYAPGELRAGSQTKPVEMNRYLTIPGRRDSPPGLNVDGAWNSKDWGKIQLVQAAGEREVTGRGGRCDIEGFVSGTRVVLLFKTRGTVSYSAELTAKGNDTLSGRYVGGQMLGNSKTKPMEMTRQK